MDLVSTINALFDAGYAADEIDMVVRMVERERERAASLEDTQPSDIAFGYVDLDDENAI